MVSNLIFHNPPFQGFRQKTPLRVIQEISGHRTLEELYKYLEVRPEQVLGAVASLSMLTPIAKPALEQDLTPQTSTNHSSTESHSKL